MCLERRSNPKVYPQLSSTKKVLGGGEHIMAIENTSQPKLPTGILCPAKMWDRKAEFSARKAVQQDMEVVPQGSVLPQTPTWRVAAMQTLQVLCPSAGFQTWLVQTIAIELLLNKSKHKQVRRGSFGECWERKSPTPSPFCPAHPPLGSNPEPTTGSRNSPIKIYTSQAKFYMAKGERGERQRGQVKKYTCVIVGSKP